VRTDNKELEKTSSDVKSKGEILTNGNQLDDKNSSIEASLSKL
jgi:hypothetical protein